MKQIEAQIILPSERKWLIGFGLLVMLFTSLPYLVGYGSQGENWRFGGFVFGVEDGNSYIAKMLSGAAGAWLFRTPYTSLDQRGFLAFLPYIMLGKLSSPPAQHEQLVGLFHLYRIAAGLMAILATYDFTALFISDIRIRRLVVFVITLGGGAGWALVLLGVDQIFGSPPLEFYSPETFGFLSLYGLPHLAAARSLLLWGLRAYLLHGSTPQGNPFFSKIPLRRSTSGWLFLGIGLFQPLTIVIGWAVICAHLFVLYLMKAKSILSGDGNERKNWEEYFRQAVLTITISSPFVIYTVAAFSMDPFLQVWQKQNLILSPHPIHYLLAYGVLMPGALNAAVKIIRLRQPTIKNDWFSLLAAWLMIFPLLAYAPYGLQRRLPEGVWTAIVILAMANLKLDGLRKVLAFSLAGTTLPSTLILISGGLIFAQKPVIPLHRPASEVEAFLKLAEYADPGDVVFSSYTTGNALPAWAPVAVVVGHGPETANLEELEPAVAIFFQDSTSLSERQKFLSDHRVAFVFWGPSERALGNWQPVTAPFLEELFHIYDYYIYKVQREPLNENQ